MRARDLVVRRGRQEILHGLTFDLPTGSVTGLLGLDADAAIQARTGTSTPENAFLALVREAA